MSSSPVPAPVAPASRLESLVRIGETHVGRGVFARRRLKADMVLGEIRGEILADHPEDSSYVMELPSEKLLEPAAPLRFVNHSCDPNCEIFYWEAEPGEPQEDRLWLQTIRPLEAGEELLIDYSWPADAAIPCRCGAAICRGWICDPAELHLVRGANGQPADLTAHAYVAATAAASSSTACTIWSSVCSQVRKNRTRAADSRTAG